MQGISHFPGIRNAAAKQAFERIENKSDSTGKQIINGSLLKGGRYPVTDDDVYIQFKEKELLAQSSIKKSS